MKTLWKVCCLSLLVFNVNATQEDLLPEGSPASQLLSSDSSSKDLSIKPLSSSPISGGDTISMDLEKKRTPKNDQILFTLQNNTSDPMPVYFSMSIADTSGPSHKKTVFEKSFKLLISPNSSEDIKKSGYEILAWLINAFKESKDPPLNSLFTIYITIDPMKLTNICNLIQSCSHCTEPLQFCVGHKVIIHSDFSAEFLSIKPLSNSPISGGDTISKEIKLKRPPENDQILFTVQNNTSQPMPVCFSMHIVDTSQTPHQTVCKGSLKKCVQTNSSKTFQQSQCKTLAWMINERKKLPKNLHTNFYISFDNTRKALTKTNGMSVSKYYSSGFLPFPFGKIFNINEDRYMVSHKNGEAHEVVSFKIDL